MRFKAALQIAVLTGQDAQEVRKRIGDRIWPDSSEETKKVNVSNLFRGQKKNYSRDVIVIICEETGVDPNFLFDYEPMDLRRLKQRGSRGKNNT